MQVIVMFFYCIIVTFLTLRIDFYSGSLPKEVDLTSNYKNGFYTSTGSYDYKIFLK